MIPTPTQPPIRRSLLVLLLGGLTMLGPFSVDAMLPAFPAMEVAMGVGPLGMQQTISVYLAAYALMVLFHGAMADALGRRRTILGWLMVFVAASAGCAMATTLPVLLFFRFLQGLSAGAGVVGGRAVLRDVLKGTHAQRSIGHVSMVYNLAPAAAPVIGGWLLGWHGWPAVFWFPTLFAGGLLVATWIGLPETLAESDRQPLNIPCLAQGYLDLIRHPGFRRMVLAGALSFNALFLYICSAPAVVIGLMGLNAQQFGWFFTPVIGGSLVGLWGSGWLSQRIAPMAVGLTGCGLCVVAGLANVGACLLGVSMHPAVVNLGPWTLLVPWTVFPVAALAMGASISFPVLAMRVLDHDPSRRGMASALLAFVGLTVSLVVGGLIAPLVNTSGLGLALVALMLTLGSWRLWSVQARETVFEEGCDDRLLG